MQQHEKYKPHGQPGREQEPHAARDSRHMKQANHSPDGTRQTGGGKGEGGGGRAPPVLGILCAHELGDASRARCIVACHDKVLLRDACRQHMALPRHGCRCCSSRWWLSSTCAEDEVHTSLLSRKHVHADASMCAGHLSGACHCSCRHVCSLLTVICHRPLLPAHPGRAAAQGGAHTSLPKGRCASDGSRISST